MASKQCVSFERGLGKLCQQINDRLRFEPGYRRATDEFDGDEMILSEGQCVLAQACTGLTGVGPKAVSAGDRVQTLSRAAIWKEE
jgi:hypothetical protein